MANEPAKATETAPSQANKPPQILRIMDLWAIDGAIKAWIEKNGFVQTVKAEIQAHAAELAGPNPSPIETTLAETAALCWFALRQAEGTCAVAKNLSIAQAAWHQLKIDHCHRRYLATLKTLATVRKLGAPIMQVNLAQQINVAGSSS
ncbi:hypothetical protein BH23PLA1_BH23PLA1_36170 [soil metagenome]